MSYTMEYFRSGGGNNSSTLCNASYQGNMECGGGDAPYSSVLKSTCAGDVGICEDSDGYVSRDSGLDLDSDTPVIRQLDNDIVMRDPHPQICGDSLRKPGDPGRDIRISDTDTNEYCGGSLLKWKVSALRQDNKSDTNGNRSSAHFRNSLHWEEFFGSSIDLTPTLLGIYDKIASSDQNGETTNQSECDYFIADEFLQDGADNRCHSPKSSPTLESKRAIQSNFKTDETNVNNNRPIHKADWEVSFSKNRNRLKMEPVDNDLDNKKRPLSISSMSSSSTSSLPRRRKRPNLSEYSDTNSAGQLDIEKLDNLLYIDDGPEMLEPKTDDEISLYSVDKGKASGDTDSQLSAERSSTYGDQSECPSFHQSDSSLAYTPSQSVTNSTADLSPNGDTNGNNLDRERPRRSPSRSSSSSMKQSGHYVSYVQRVVTELVETERSYVQNLRDIQEGYYRFILDTSSLKITDADTETLFGNIIEIYNFSCQFYEELESCGMDPIQVAECFVRNSEGFVVYAEYCTNYPSAVVVLTELMHDPQQSEIFKQRQLALGHSLPLGAYLLKPVQRVLKYHLLLQNILKHYKKEEPGWEKLELALDHMTDMSHHINEMKRKHEHAVRVQEIQSLLEDYEDEVITRLGELVLEGSFRMFGVKASRQVFLFQKGVIIAKRKEDGMFSCKAYIPCAKLMLVESIPKEPLNFQILPFDNPRGAHTIHARNLDQKRKWCQEIKRLILESFSSKIPDNVKNLIIEELGRSKEEEHIGQLGGGDSNKTNVTTPDYLEKRLKARRKSGTALLTEMLRTQKTKRSKSETPSPKQMVVRDAMAYNKDNHSSKANGEAYGFRSNTPTGINTLPRKFKSRVKDTDYFNKSTEPSPTPSPRKHRTSVQRSHSFQQATRDSGNFDHILKDQSNTESMSVDNLLSQSDGPPLRTPSFRIATKISPIRLDSTDCTDGIVNVNDLRKSVLTEQLNVDNIPPSVRKSIENLDGKDMSLTARDVIITDNQENLNESYLDELSLGKRGRYSSMPVLNSDPYNSPKASRINSDRTSQSPTINHTSITRASLLQHSKQIDIKPYFSYSREKLRQDIGQDNSGSNLSRDGRPVGAFHDAFANLRKSQENLNNQKPSLTLTQPKPFTSTLKNSVSMMNSQARLNKLNKMERFTKGSLTDLSHLKEDPWIRNKQRSFTESKVSRPVTRNNSVRETKTELSGSERIVNKHIGRLSMDSAKRHERTHSFTGDDRTFSRDNLDWLVYANRNSIPVSGTSVEELNQRSKYWTPPRGSMEPPPHIRDSSGNMGREMFHPNIAVMSTPLRYSQSDYRNKDLEMSAADSSVSLSATTTSSDTCSSPDILKDGVFDETGSPDKFFPRDRTRMQISRSFSSPETKRSQKFRKQLQEDRPASADILGDVNSLNDSERLVAEMEHYMKRSTSSSGSLSSTNNKFPTCIPTFEKKNEQRNTNRDSCLSSGSASSYESASNDFSNSDEGIVDSIMNKFHNITAKFTGKKTESQLQSDFSPSGSPTKLKQEDHPVKISHSLSLRVKPGSQKPAELNLPNLLRDLEPGSEAIGSRMANTDLDDYATFSLPRTHQQLSLAESSNIDIETAPQSEVVKQKERDTNKKPLYGRYSNSSLISPSTSKMTESGSKLQSQSNTQLASPVTSLKNLNIQQSDSAFSIQSEEVDSSSPEDSPRGASGVAKEAAGSATSTKDSGGFDTYYERRLSAVFSNDDAFRDSAVYCDDIDSPTPVVSPSEDIAPLKVPIKAYVQQLEEKNKSKPPLPMKAKAKEPSAGIKQRMESLAANFDRNKSCSTSRSMSSATSRTHSQSSSRASSEEKQVPSVALKEYIDSKFPMEGRQEDRQGFRSPTPVSGHERIKNAFSLTRLDQLNSDVDNLVIMKGWVKDLIDKFQTDK